MTNTSFKLRHSIADVERDTGLSKDTLRVWERRYGFPTPERDALGERQYDDEQLLRLRHVRRLLDAGHRPGQVVALPLDDLLRLSPERVVSQPEDPPPVPTAASPVLSDAPNQPDLNHWMRLLREHEALALRQALEQHLHTHGLLSLVRDGVAPMNVWVGQSWLEGQLEVFEEHLYTEMVQALLRQAMGQIVAEQPRRSPRVLMTTVPGEPHALGLLMAECVMVLEGCDTVGLGVQTPLPDIVAAARACRADVVALGFTAVQNPRDVHMALSGLREQLSPSVDLWAGGQCPALYRRVRRQGSGALPVFTPMAKLEDIVQGVAQWRERQAASAPGS